MYFDSGGFMPGTSSIHEFLRDAHVPYVVVPHQPAFTAQEEAAATHVPGRDWAKVVVCFADGEPIEAVLPATLDVDLDRLRRLARASMIRLADEKELNALFPGCEPGAMPPFGPIYGQDVFVDVGLAAEDEIVFNAGTHTEAIRMRWPDFAASVRPIVGRFAQIHADKVGEYRLSYRE
jgi:Ala-tRNA(Pro) deacylase